MQAYGAAFARVYYMKWGGFADGIAPKIMDLYTATAISQQNKTVFDLCCGTGHLAKHFLEAGYRVVGLDASEPMLHFARENTKRFVETGQAQFVQGDASQFRLNNHFGLVVSTYDALNHLENEKQLSGCFHSVFSVLNEGGLFIFDLNTRVGLRRWNSIFMDDSSDELFLINRGIYDGQGDKAWTRITGFVRQPKGFYERFDETVFNTVFDLAHVREMLLEIGWCDAHFARIDDLNTPLTDPEKEEQRVFMVARK